MINDGNITAYIIYRCGLLDEIVKSDDWKGMKIKVWHTFFYTKLSNARHEGVARWTQKVPVFEHERIIFPINLNDTHWFACLLDIENKRTVILDSMCREGGRMDHHKVVLDYVQKEAEVKRIPFDRYVWCVYVCNEGV